MKAMVLPSGENTQASGRGAEASGVRAVRRLVRPVARLVTQTLLSMTWAIWRPSGLHVKAEATGQAFRVTCLGGPPLGEIVQS